MPVEPKWNITAWPLSGNVDQTINPWNFLNNAMGQFGYININQTISSNRPMERRIVEEVAGYGKQLGRITDVLEVLVKRLPASGLDKDAKKAIADFHEIVRGIEAVKKGEMVLTTRKVDALISEVRKLKTSDAAAYRDLVGKIRDELN